MQALSEQQRWRPLTKHEKVWVEDCVERSDMGNTTAGVLE